MGESRSQEGLFLLLLVFAKEEGVVGGNPQGWRFPGEPSPAPAPPGQRLPGEEPCGRRAGPAELEGGGVSIQGRGMHRPLTPAAPLRAVLWIPYGTAIMSPGFFQPLLSSHRGSSPKPRSGPSHPIAGLALLSGEKTHTNEDQGPPALSQGGRTVPEPSSEMAPR